MMHGRQCHTICLLFTLLSGLLAQLLCIFFNMTEPFLIRLYNFWHYPEVRPEVSRRSVRLNLGFLCILLKEIHHNQLPDIIDSCKWLHLRQHMDIIGKF